MNAERLRKSGARIVITGASGWIGQVTLEMLEAALGAGFAERVLAFGSHTREIVTRTGRRIPISQSSMLSSLTPQRTLLLHYAFMTKERVVQMSSADYFGSSEALTEAIVDAIPKIGVAQMVFLSSGAVYGLPTRSDRTTLDDPEANPYGTQKLRDEERFSQVCSRNGVRLVIPRIFNVSGRLINKHDSYVLSSVINAALSGVIVELRAQRRVVRGYVAVRDVLDVVFGWLLSGTKPEKLVFDTGGEVVEVGELALRVLKMLDRTDLQIKRPPFGCEPDDIYLGDGKKFEQLATSLGVSLLPLDQQIAETAAYLKGLRT